MRSKKGMTAFAWIMLGAIVFGLGGYGVTNFGGGLSSIGTVGNQEIAIQDYSRALQQELDAYRAQFGNDLTAEQALQMGVDTQVQQRLVINAALDDFDGKIGLSIGDKALRQAIAATSAFQGPGGKFDKTTYAMVLQQNGLTETDYEAKMRKDLAHQMLQQALGGNITAPAEFVDAISAYAGERRGFTLLKIGTEALTAPVPAPTDAELHSYYDAHKADFTDPEAKVLTFAALTPATLADKMTVTDAQVQQAYDKSKAQFENPATAHLLRLVYPDEAAAQAARAELDAGKKTFDQLVADRGLTPAAIDLGEVGQDGLPKAAGEAIFALKAPGVVGPLMSELGPALYQVVALTPAKTTSFAEAKAQIAETLRQQAAAQKISTEVEGINDKLAGGATLEDLAKETDMQIGHMDYVAGDTGGMAAYPEFRAAADKVKQGDYPSLIQLSDGGVVALQLDKIRPAALIPFDKVADKVKAAWTTEATAKALKARADAIAAAVKSGTDIASFGKPEAIEPVLRSGYLDGTPKALLDDVFKLKAPGDLATAEQGGAAWIARLDKIVPADPASPDAVKLRAQLAARAAQGISSDGFDMFATALVANTKVSLDRSAIAAVNAQFH